MMEDERPVVERLRGQLEDREDDPTARSKALAKLRYQPVERPSPREIDALWDRFLREHGHLDRDGNVIFTERLQREVGMEAGLKPLFALARRGDTRAAEVILRTCLARPQAPVEVRVQQMDRDQLVSREQRLLAALSPTDREKLEAALARAILPAVEGE